MCNRCVCVIGKLIPRELFCVIGVYRKYHMEAPKLRKRIPSRKLCVTDVLCNYEIDSQIIKMCVCNHFGPYSRHPHMQNQPKSVCAPPFRRLFVTCDVFTRYFFTAFPWLFRGPHLLRKTVFGRFSWLFRGFFRGLFRGFFVALILGKFYAYSPWKSLLTLVLRPKQLFTGVSGPSGPESAKSLKKIGGLQKSPRKLGNGRNTVSSVLFRRRELTP